MAGRRKGWRRWVRRVIVLLAVVGVCLFLFRDRVFPVEPEPPQTTAVVYGDIELTVLAAGELEAIRLVSVGSRATGRIESLHVQLGESVRQGDLIAEIESMTQQNVLKNAEASLANVKAQKRLEEANLKQAEAEFDRQTLLMDKGVGIRQNYESAEASLEVTRAKIEALDAQIAQAEIQSDSAKVELDYTRITAPMDGVVVAVAVEEGQTVNAVQSAPTIIKLATLDTMTISAEISEADVTRVQVGQPVYFTILGEPDQKYHSTIRSISPAPQSLQTESAASSSNRSDQAVYYNAEFDVPNPGHKLRVSMTAEVSIVLAQVKHVLLVPNSAIHNGKDGKLLVQVMDGEKAVETRTIEIGISDGIQTEIVSGLSESERVVTRFVDPTQEAESEKRSGSQRMFR